MEHAALEGDAYVPVARFRWGGMSSGDDLRNQHTRRLLDEGCRRRDPNIPGCGWIPSSKACLRRSRCHVTMSVWFGRALWAGRVGVTRGSERQYLRR